MITLTANSDEPGIFEPQLPLSPYPGLRPFQKSEWPIFFGRERMTDSVIRLLLEKRLLVVHGTSGNGKSSLIRAGVLARLDQEHARSGVRWRTCAATPGNSPLNNLAKSFADLEQNSRRDWIEFRRTLNRGRQSAPAISKLLGLGDGNRLCVLLDQFEEIFHDFGSARTEESDLLIELLVGFDDAPPEGLFFIVTMRSEFLGLCSRFPGLAEVINKSQYLLPRMDTLDLLRAIREPAVIYGGGVTEQLAERLIVDARISQDELPLVQHGLSQLWRSAEGSGSGEHGPVLGLPQYLSRGSLSKLISDHADQVAEQAVDKDVGGDKIIEELFRALTAINSEGVAVRRPQSFARLLAITGATEDRLRPILEAFRRPGVSFITPYPPATIKSDTIIDISHEALIRNWSKIADRSKGWLQKEFRDGLSWQALCVQADSFLSDPANLLSEATTEARSAWLRGRNEAWAGRYGGMWLAVERLLDASRTDIQRRIAQDTERKQAAEALRVQMEHDARTRKYMAAVSIVAVLMTALALLAFYEWQNSQAAQHNEQVQRIKAEVNAQREAEARKNADKEKQKAVEEAEKAKAALQRSTSYESLSSAQDFVIKYGSNRDSLLKALTQLTDADNDRDELKISLYGQAIGLLAKFATGAEIHSTMEILIRNFQRSRESSGIALALSSLAAGMNEAQTQLETDVLLREMIAQNTPEENTALAFALAALARKVSKPQADQIERYLFQSLLNTDDPTEANAIASALSSLNWTPPSGKSSELIEHLLKLITRTSDPNSIGTIAVTITALAPSLGQQEAQRALDQIRSLSPQLSEAMKPAAIALSARTEQISEPSTSITTVTQDLFQRVSKSRWCSQTRLYSLQFAGNNAVVWRDNVGSVDTELVKYNGVTEAETTTQKSVHEDGKSEIAGTNWSYRLGPSGGTLSVKSSTGKSFSLTRC